MAIARAAWPALLTAALIAGCGRKGEERITQAFPLSPEVSLAKSKFDAAAVRANANLYPLRRDYEAQVAQRALDCRQDYWPGMFDEVADIRLHIVNDACFREADARLITWLATHRMGWLAAEAPTHTKISFTLPPSTQSPITNAVFADVAGVVLLQTDEGYTLSDLNGRRIREAKTGYGHQYSLSANGRLLADGKGGDATIYDTETGEAFVSLSGLRSPKVHFVGDQGLVFQRADGVILYRDFTNLQQAYVGLDSSAVIAAVLNDDKKGFAVIGNERMAMLSLRRDDKRLYVIVERRANVAPSLGENAAPQLAHGAVLFRGDHNEILRLRSRNNFVETIAILPPGVSRVLPTADPTRYLLTSIGSSGTSYARLDLFLQKIAALDPVEMPSRNLLWAPAVRRNARINGNRLEWVDQFPDPTGQSQSYEKALTDYLMRRQHAPEPGAQAPREAEATQPEPLPPPPPPPSIPSAPVRMQKFSPGMEGIYEAMEFGVLRPGNSSDLDAWKFAYFSRKRRPVGQNFAHALGPRLFVITGPMTLPAGSDGLVFILASGAPAPAGELGRVTVLDVDTGSCSGRCSALSR